MQTERQHKQEFQKGLIGGELQQHMPAKKKDRETGMSGFVLHSILLNSRRHTVKAEEMPAVCLDGKHKEHTLAICRRSTETAESRAEYNLFRFF